MRTTCNLEISVECLSKANCCAYHKALKVKSEPIYGRWPTHLYDTAQRRLEGDIFFFYSFKLKPEKLVLGNGILRPLQRQSFFTLVTSQTITRKKLFLFYGSLAVISKLSIGHCLTCGTGGGDEWRL